MTMTVSEQEVQFGFVDRPAGSDPEQLNRSFSITPVAHAFLTYFKAFLSRLF